MNKRGFVPIIGLILLLASAVGLGLVVWRANDLTKVFFKPKADAVSVLRTGKSIVISATASKPVTKFKYTFSECLGEKIVDKNTPSNTDSLRITYAEMKNCAGKKVEVRMTYTDADGAVSSTGINCIASFDVESPVAKTCLISATVNGQTINVNSLTGTGGTGKATLSRTDTGTIPNIGDPFYTDNNNTGHKYYDITGRSTISNLPAGTYKVFCHIPDEPGKCSGNPFCSSLPANECAGWASCGSASSVELTVATAPPPPTCTGAPCTGEGRERDWRGYWVPRACAPFDNEADCKNVDRCNWNSACAKPGGGGGGGGGSCNPNQRQEKVCPNGVTIARYCTNESTWPEWDNCLNNPSSYNCSQCSTGRRCVPKPGDPCMGLPPAAPASGNSAAGQVYSGER